MIIDIVGFSLCIIIPIVIIVGSIWCRKREKEQWNNGTCAECGEKWIRFDTDSQGGRMYRCNNWHFCDISYKVDK